MSCFSLHMQRVAGAPHHTATLSCSFQAAGEALPVNGPVWMLLQFTEAVKDVIDESLLQQPSLSPDSLRRSASLCAACT